MSNSTNQESPVVTDTVGSNRWYLSSAPIVRALVHLCVPMAAAMIVGAVYNVINAGFIGSLHDSALLAAVTLGAPLLGLVMAVGGVFGVGGGALSRDCWERPNVSPLRPARSNTSPRSRSGAR